MGGSSACWAWVPAAAHAMAAGGAEGQEKTRFLSKQWSSRLHKDSVVALLPHKAGFLSLG